MNGSRSSSCHRLVDGLDKYAVVIATNFVHGEAAETNLLDILSLGSCNPNVNDQGSAWKL